MKMFFPLLMITLSEASIGVFVKLVGDQVPIMSLNFFRVLFAALFLAVALGVMDRRALRFPKDNIRDTMILGALIAGQISLYNLAMKLTTIANAVIFWSIAPFFVFLFSWWFLDESPKKQHIFIFLLALVGLFIAEPFGGGKALGNVIALLTGVLYAGAVTFMRHEGTTESNNDVFWFLTMASVYLVPFVFLFGPGEILATSTRQLFGLPVPTLVWVIGLGMLSTGLAYLLISVVLKKISANVYSLVDIIVSPLVAAILGYLVFDEVPSRHVIYGGILLLSSGVWLTHTMSEHVEEGGKEDHPAAS